MVSALPRLLFAALLTLVATPTRADALDDSIAAEMRRQQIPGLSIAVVQDGRIVREGGYGLANLEHRVPVTPDTIFQSGSVGKQFTAALVLMLARDGKLGLDDAVTRHVQGLPAAWKAITLRHLLTHTSGLADADEAIKVNELYDEARLIRTARALPPRFKPGSKWEYNNFGYQLLGIVCSRVGGAFYGDQLRKRIFTPAGMASRIINERDIIAHRAAGYQLVDGVIKNQDWVSPWLNTTADGSIYLTARDLARWDIALGGDSLLDARQKHAMWTGVTLAGGAVHPYGFGWMLSPTLGQPSVWHDGEWQGFTSQITRFSEQRISVIVLTNLAGADPGAVVEVIARAFL